jgi:hypothetical protein
VIMGSPDLHHGCWTNPLSPLTHFALRSCLLSLFQPVYFAVVWDLQTPKKA